MSSTICKHLLTKIFPKLVLGILCCFSLRSVAIAACGDRHTQSGFYDAWGNGMYVIEVASGSNGFYHCNQDIYPQSGGSDDKRMRIAYKCSAGSTDNKCVNVASQGYQYYSMVIGSYHLEKVSSGGNSCGFQCVKNNRDCRDFGKQFPVGATLAGYQTAQNVNFDFSSSNPNNLCSSATICSNYITFNYGDETQSDNKNNKKGIYGYQHNNERCSLIKSGLKNAGAHCSSGTVTWKAEKVLSGDVITGFKLVFKKNDSQNSRHTYECNTCEIGWKLADGQCSNCDTSKNFTMYNNQCFCKKGYTYDSGQGKCIPYENANFVEVNGEYYCATGYETSKYNSPAESSGYRRFNCVCKSYVFSGSNCTCPIGFEHDNPQNPEDATCVINANTPYNDSTGQFTVGPNGSSCNTSDSNWWEQQN